MDIDQEKVEQTVWALLYLTSFKGQIWIESLEGPRLGSDEFLT